MLFVRQLYTFISVFVFFQSFISHAVASDLIGINFDTKSKLTAVMAWAQGGPKLLTSKNVFEIKFYRENKPVQLDSHPRLQLAMPGCTKPGMDQEEVVPQEYVTEYMGKGLYKFTRVSLPMWGKYRFKFEISLNDKQYQGFYELKPKRN